MIDAISGTQRGLSRRALLKVSAVMTALLALPPHTSLVMAQRLAESRRRSVIWLSFQECTGCTEALTRSYEPTIEGAIFELLSLDYHHTLQAVSGEAAEAARRAAMTADKGRYVVVVDGSVPTGSAGVYSTTAGMTNLQMLEETVRDAAVVIAVGTCASHGGIAAAKPNPTGAVAISDLVKGKPLVNIPGCPPIPEAIAATLAHVVAFGKAPDLDDKRRPVSFYGQTVHDRCYRKEHFRAEQYAGSFDDEGARKGWCLLKLGCRGQQTRNACASFKWNGGTSFPIQSGHGCIGCSEAGFWDTGSFYAAQPRLRGSGGGRGRR